MTTFVLCYLVFIFFPVAGPYYVFPRPPAWFIDNCSARLVYETLGDGQLVRRGVSELARRGCRRGRHRRLAGDRGGSGSRCVIPTVLLTVGVVYCQMHYGVDAVAGLVVGIAVASRCAMARADGGR